MYEKLKALFISEEELSPEHKKRIRQLQEIIDVPIDNSTIYIQALRHRSTLTQDQFGPADSYERLEFLGDAVLDLIVTEIIFDRYPKEEEGFLTKLRAQIVKGDTLAMFAKEMGLSSLLLLADPARGQGIKNSKSILADLFEAVTAAIYLDAGYGEVSRFIQMVLNRYINYRDIITTLDNYKSLLLEYAQARHLEIPTYSVVSESGPGHNKTFETEVYVDGEAMARGVGKSKKEAEQKAANKALNMLKKNE